MSATKRTNKQEVVNNTNRENSENSSQIVQIEQELNEINPQLFKGIPIQKKQEIIKTLVSIKMHSGPLPDPETLFQYDKVISNGADRIMAMAEKQQDHRIELEKTAVRSQLSQSKKGQIFGFIISMVIVGCGTYLAICGHEKTGVVLIGTTLVALAGIFVLGRFKNQKSKE